MTATIASPPAVTTTARTGSRPLWIAGIGSGLVAGAATAAYAAIAHGAGVSFDVGGEPIPALGFAQITVVAALIGTAIAAVLSRRARTPRRTFLRTTVALTVLSFLPDVFADAPNGTRLALAASHVIAFAIVVPVLAARCAD